MATIKHHNVKTPPTAQSPEGLYYVLREDNEERIDTYIVSNGKVKKQENSEEKIAQLAGATDEKITQLVSKFQPDGLLRKANTLYYEGGYDSTANSITQGDINLHKTSGYLKNKIGDRIKIKGASSVTSYNNDMQNRQTNISASAMAEDFVVFEFIRDGYFAINYEFSPGGNIENKVGDINTILVAFYASGADIVEDKVDKVSNARLITEDEIKKFNNKIDKSALGTFVESRNILNPKNIVAGLVSNANNAGLLAADWRMAVFYIPGFSEDEAKTITISGWNTVRNEIAVMKGEIPSLPITVNTNENVLKSGTSSYVFGKNKSSGRITVTITDEEATWIAITVRDTSESDSVFSYLQVEKGESATEYIAYGDSQFTLDKSLFISTDLIVRKKDSTLLIRSSLSKEKDIVRTISLVNSSTNGASNLLSSKLINKTDDIESDGVVFHGMGDTVPAPFQMRVRGESSSTYSNIAGNHGIANVADINCPSHGKTNADLWSVWRGANNAEVYIVEVIDANNLRYACKPYIVIDEFDKITEATSPLTHVSGATNTANIVFTGSLYEYKPAIRDILVKVYADDKEITKSGDYSCNELKVIDKHIVADPTQVTVQTPYYPYNNGVMCENTVIHRFTKYAYISELLPVFKKSHKARNISSVQPQCLTKGTYAGLKAFSMNIKPKNGYDFDLGVDLVAGIGSTLYVYKTDLKDQSKHYQQLSEILYTGSQPSVGMGAGYLPVGCGKSDIQASNDVIFGISTVEKYYPYGKTGIVELDEIPRISGFISYFDASVNPDFSMCFLVPYSSGYLLYLKLSNDVTNKDVYLPDEVLNREFDILWNGNINIITEDYTTNEGLIISGDIGDYCVLRIK